MKFAATIKTIVTITDTGNTPELARNKIEDLFAANDWPENIEIDLVPIDEPPLAAPLTQ